MKKRTKDIALFALIVGFFVWTGFSLQIVGGVEIVIEEYYSGEEIFPDSIEYVSPDERVVYIPIENE